ncbi:growth/differentiation factor 8 [Agrilus planipennis]|uniref:Growth/differentiation factor 8 n=1 Tax=Agrilus planipennis TaxID=224129 RepID=A0A1W4XK63_AGRPL|nr:growth/differentiation factor 8 [Agrilus planipennis]
MVETVPSTSLLRPMNAPIVTSTCSAMFSESFLFLRQNNPLSRLAVQRRLRKTHHHNNSTILWHHTVIVMIVLVSTVLPISCDRFTNRSTNSIDSKKSKHFSEFEEITASPGCGSCRVREEMKNRSIQAIKDNVLQKLGLSKAPNVTTKSIPAHLLALIDQGYVDIQGDAPFQPGPFVSEEEDNYHVRTEKVVTFSQPYPRLRHSWHGHDILHFSFSDGVTKYQVANATLFVFVKGVDKRPQPIMILEVYKVYKNPDRPDIPGTVRVASRRINQPLGHGEWIKIDVTAMVSEWFKSARDNYGFIVNATINKRKTPLESVNGNVPFVEISTVEPKRRTRRNIAYDCDDKNIQDVCCRYPLTINFEDFGWDFIIAPKKYEAYYCSGRCPYLTMQKQHHTHLAKMASPDIEGPCCAPRKMSGISMLYFDENYNVIFGNLPGMVVDKCACS